MSALKKVIENGTLSLPPNFPTGRDYKKWKNILYGKDWVVYTKQPFSKVSNVVNYLGRYSHRVALTNHRIKNMAEDKVTFGYKDYKDDAKSKLMTLEGTEFLRRFCLHILPKRFQKIRQYGYVSNASKAKSIKLARHSLGVKVKNLLSRKERKILAIQRIFSTSVNQCPCCKKGKMIIVVEWKRNKSPPAWVIPLIV